MRIDRRARTEATTGNATVARCLLLPDPGRHLVRDAIPTGHPDTTRPDITHRRADEAVVAIVGIITIVIAIPDADIPDRGPTREIASGAADGSGETVAMKTGRGLRAGNTATTVNVVETIAIITRMIPRDLPTANAREMKARKKETVLKS